jgi:4-amino-4-deoxy-L-arabinose transferase-like glycosyltransferase
VETHPPAPRPTSIKSWARRVAWGILIVATLYLCYFSHLDAIGFVGPDEPRYAWIARDMAETGDWITPRLYGKPWFEKPPLYYWTAALSFKLFGVSESAARLPSALSALLATLALAWLAWRFYGSETARWVLLLLPTTVGMIGFSHAAATDMPFSAMLTVAMVAAAALLGLAPAANSLDAPPNAPSGPSPSATSVFFGLFLGLAVLAKGPAAIVLCGGAVFFWALFTKRWRDTCCLVQPAGIAAFCVIALPWYILCALRNPDFLRVFIIEHNFKRYLTPEFQHIQPFWFYAGIILIAFLPWTAALLWTLFAGLRRAFARPMSAQACFLLCWAAFCVVFFTISRSKLPGYVLPAVPPIALILSRSAVSLASTKRRSFGLVSLAVGALFAYAFVAVLRADDRLLKNLAAYIPLLSLLLLFFAVANLLLGVLYLFSRRSAALVTVVLSLFLTFGMLDLAEPYTPASILSPRYLAYQIQADQAPLAALRFSRIKRATLYGLNFYLHSELQEWDGDPAREVYVLTTGGPPCSQTPKEMTCESLLGVAGKVEDVQLLHLVPRASALAVR